jgi:hypothetical protein
MPIGTPTAITGITFAAGGAITTTVDAPAGSLTLVAAIAAALNTTLTGMTCSDNATGGSNTYVVEESSAVNLNSFACAIIASINTAHDLPIGGVITPAGTVGAGAFLAAWKVSGCNGGLDKIVTANSATGTATSLSQSTGVLTVSNEIVFSILSFNQNAATFVESTGFTTLINPTSGGVAVSYAIVSSTASVTYAPSWTTGLSYAFTLATFEITSAGGAAACSKGSLLQLGVGCSIGWRAALLGGGAWRAAKAIERNGVITRRGLILPRISKK